MTNPGFWIIWIVSGLIVGSLLAYQAKKSGKGDPRWWFAGGLFFSLLAGLAYKLASDQKKKRVNR